MVGHWQYAPADVPPARIRRERAPLGTRADACWGLGLRGG